MPDHDRNCREDLAEIAQGVMIHRGLRPTFPREVEVEAEGLSGPADSKDPSVRDLRDLPWVSIDNDDSKDLDQITVAVPEEGGLTRVLVGVADVDGLVPKGSAIDRHARRNTTSVYTAGRVFSMIPERLSWDLTSLNPDEDRLAVVMEMTLDARGEVQNEDLYRARVRNHAKLAYPDVAAWLDGGGPPPGPERMRDRISEQLRIQGTLAQAMKERRFEAGALEFESREPHPVFDGATLVGLVPRHADHATELIENFMVGANGVAARLLDRHRVHSLRRVVRVPDQWPRIVEVAGEAGFKLPAEPDGVALGEFLSLMKHKDPEAFPDLSLVIVKLMGRGEYVCWSPGEDPPGHFGLAVEHYTHSTAPNRRYPDLITQRLLKRTVGDASVSGYGVDELHELAQHCTEMETVAEKVERRMRKSAAAMFLCKRIGEHFDAIVTGCSDKGTWVRIPDPPVEGKLVKGSRGCAVGNRLRVKLLRAAVDLGYLDFARV